MTKRDDQLSVSFSESDHALTVEVHGNPLVSGIDIFKKNNRLVLDVHVKSSTDMNGSLHDLKKIFGGVPNEQVSLTVQTDAMHLVDVMTKLGASQAVIDSVVKAKKNFLERPKGLKHQEDELALGTTSVAWGARIVRDAIKKER